MANTIKIKRSAVSGKVPAVGDLELGELAINTFDGKLFLKKNVSGNESIVDITAGGLDATSLLNLVKTVDGSGSGLDADLLDGLNSSSTNSASTIVARDASGLTGLAGVNFDGTAAVTGAAGRLWYDGTTGQLNFSHDGIVTQQIGEETYVYAKASAAVTEGQVVVRTGAVGQSGSITVAPAGASLTSSDTIVGVATQTVTIGEFCRITTTGVVRGINTTGQPVGETWADGDILYYSASGGGALTKIKPTSPNAKCVIATVISAHQSAGSIQVEIQRGSTLGGTDSNVEITSAADKDFLIYNGTNGRWENKQLVLGTDTTGNYVATIAGTANQITVSGSGSESSAVTLSLPQDIATASTPTFAGLNIGAVTISEYIADTVGAMVTGNTESGISVTYDDAVNTLNFDVADFTITLTGDVTGTGTVTNLGNVSFATTIAANSVALGTDTTGNYVASIATTVPLSGGAVGSEGGALTLSLASGYGDTQNPYASKTANYFLAAPNGTAGVPTFRAIVAEDIPTLNQSTTGNAATATKLATARTISLSGDATGSVSFDGSANADIAVTIAANNVALGTDTTGNYVATIAGTTNQITVTGSGSETAAVTLSLPQDIATTSNVTFNNLTVSGDLTVNGTTTTVNSTTVTLDDPIVTLGGDTAPTVDDGKDRGVEFRWHNGTVAKVGFFGFDDSTQKFTFIPDATNTAEVFSGTKGTIDANVEWVDVLNKPDPVVTVTLTGDVTGTANATLTDLASGTISVATTIAANSVALGTDTTGNYVASITNGSYITGGNGGSEGAALTLAVDATSANTASKVVARDASGNFSAGTITAALSGNASTATTLQTARNINGVSFNGSADITVTANTTNSHIIKFDTGATEGTDLYTFNGSAAKTIDIKAGTNVTLTKTAGVVTVNASVISVDWSEIQNKPDPVITVTLTGDVTGSGNATLTDLASGTISFATTIAANSVALGTDTTGNYVAGLTAGTGVTISGTAGEGWSPTVAIGQAVATSSNVQFNSLGVGTAGSGTAGEIRATNQVVAYYSDDRLKTKLGTIENALDKVMSLEGFYYEANQTAKDLGYEVKREVGVSAQSVQVVLPEVVKEAPISDEYLTVQYERLVPLLIQAIKEQQLQIEELKKLINK